MCTAYKERKKIDFNRYPELEAFIMCALIAGIIMIPAMILNHGYFALSNDFSAEEIPFGMLMNRAIKSGETWSWGIDLGGNLLESFGFYNIGSVFYWISLLFPAELYPRVIGWLFILKIAVAGYSSALWMKRYLHKKDAILIGAMLYAFSGAQCINIVFYHFQDVIALFPFMLAALDKMILDKKKGCFALACAVNLLCNPIFFWGTTCFTVLYYIFRFLLPNLREKGQIKNILTCFWEGILGCLISGVIVVPTFLSMMGNKRATAVLPISDWFLMTVKEWLIEVGAFFFPAESMDSYSAIVSNDWGSWGIYLPLFGLAFVLTYIFHEKNWLSSLIKCCFVMAVIPILNSVFIAFSPDRYGRWLFMFSLLLSLATAVVCEKADKYRDSLKYGLIMTFTIALCCLKRIHYDGIEIFRIHRFVLNIMSAVLGVVVLAAIIKNKRSECTKIYKGATIFFSVCLLGVSVFDYQNGALDNTGINFRIESNQYSKNVSTYLTEIPSLLKRNVLPYRYYFDEGIGYTYYNLSMTNELPSTNSFISTCHSSVFDFYRALGINRGNMSPAGPVGMQELLGARYIVTMKKLSNLKLIKHIKNANNQDFYIYANQAALPMGTLYDSYITKSEFNKVSAELRALVMLHTLVIEDQDVEKVEKQLKHAPEYIELAGEELLKRTIQNKNPNSNFETKKNTLNIRLEADKKEFAFYSIPYDRFWKVKVNGYDAEMYNCNGLIAIPVEKGENIIEFRYEYTPFKVGISLSAVGCVLFALYDRLQKNVKQKESSENNEK
jgi:uncharacterized membrane protein YfhO